VGLSTSCFEEARTAEMGLIRREIVSIKKFYELQNSSCPHLNSGKLIADFSEAAMDVVALRYGQVRNIVNRHQ